ncbi:MAG: PilZ domain-containing protein [Labilithrix sp.]|nr:PilZ domain-containing protein [Labilithrix sp.]
MGSAALPKGRDGHFRAHDRRPVRLAVHIAGQRSGAERQAHVIDLSIAGAGIETEEPLVPGDRLSVTFATPTMWDPLVLTAVVAWAHSPRFTAEVDAFGRPRSIARAGLAFEYPDPSAVLAMFEMLATLGYE